MRIFLSIAIPTACKDGLGACVGHLQRSGVEARWVPMGNMHLSLVFLGEVADIDVVTDCATHAASTIASFDIQVDGLGVFGRRGRPRVLWAGVKPCSALMHLQERLVQVLTDVGFPLETRAYMPHVTLGRIKPVHKVPSDLSRILRRVEENMPAFDFPVAGFDIMQSYLDNQGSRYEVVEKIAFG